MNKVTLLFAALTAGPVVISADALAAGNQVEVEFHKVNQEGIGEPIGTIRVASHEDGVLFQPDLKGLEPGLHGFHLHENPTCDPAEKEGKVVPAGAAGSHFDPDDGKGGHNGPYEEGHKGDLPTLYVNQEGEATHTVLAPRLEFQEVLGHALIIHQGGDNYSDEPKPLGGGGGRVACGVVTTD